MCIRDSVVALGQPELFFNAVAKAEAGHAAGTDGVQALQGLVRHLGAVSYTHLDVYKRQMVDFSCALKLSMPLAVLSAMRECGASHITVKGGKYLETRCV